MPGSVLVSSAPGPWFLHVLHGKTCPPTLNKNTHVTVMTASDCQTLANAAKGSSQANRALALSYAIPHSVYLSFVMPNGFFSSLSPLQIRYSCQKVT